MSIQKLYSAKQRLSYREGEGAVTVTYELRDFPVEALPLAQKLIKEASDALQQKLFGKSAAT